MLTCVACTHSEDTQSQKIAAHKDECQNLAESRLGLYVHSDIYPLSDKEKSDALTSLYNECLKQYGVRTPPVAAPVAATAPLAPAANALPPGMQMAPSAAAQPATEAAAPVKDEPVRKAVAAPVASVASNPVPPPAPITSAPVTPPVSSPFAVAKPPSPAVALKLRQPLEGYQQPTNDNGKSELENIITKQ